MLLLWIIFLKSLELIHLTTAYGGAHVMKKLHNDLFSNYSPEVRSCLDCKRPTNVYAMLNVAYIAGLNWVDEILKWDPGQYEGINKIYVKQDKVWRPDIAVYNSIADTIYVGDENLLVTVNANGSVAWEPVINLGVACKVDITNYPFDESICGVNLTSWIYPETHVNLMAAAKPIRLNLMMTHSQYFIEPHDVPLMRLFYEGEVFLILVFNIRLIRRPSYLVMTLLIPIVLLAVLCAVSFLLPPEVPEKTSIAITLLLAYAVYLSVVDKELPEKSDQLSYIILLVMSLLFLSFFCVAGNALVVINHKKNKRPHLISDDIKLQSDEAPKNEVLVNNLHFKSSSALEDNNSLVLLDNIKTTHSVRRTKAEKINFVFLVLNIVVIITIVTTYAVAVLS